MAHLRSRQLERQALGDRGECARRFALRIAHDDRRAFVTRLAHGAHERDLSEKWNLVLRGHAFAAALAEQIVLFFTATTHVVAHVLDQADDRSAGLLEHAYSAF